MNLYQAGYTRKGRQGEGAGWSIVAPSEEMSRIAMEGFRGISGNLVELVNRFPMPKSAVGLFCYDRFWFYLHINYAVSKTEAKDARGVSFVHGYSFSTEENDILCQNPEMLCGITDQTFQKNYDASIKAYPVVHELPYRTMNETQLKKKYKLSTEEYRRLLTGVTCALEEDVDSLCIKISCPLEEYCQVCLEVMYLILRGLPYHFRAKVTFFSYKGGKTTLYFSDKIEGDHYFDLDTMAYACNKSLPKKYEFPQIYAWEDEKQRQFILRQMADFIDQTLDLPRKEVHCEQIEHAFQASRKDLMNQVTNCQKNLDLLCSYTKLQWKQVDTTENYLAKLLELLNQSGQLVEDIGVFHWILSCIQQSNSKNLQEVGLTFYIRQILAQEEQKGYETLLKLYRENKKHYRILSDRIHKKNPTYYAQYYEKAFLPEVFHSLNSVAIYLEEYKNQLEKEKTWDRLLQRITEQEMKATKSFAEQRNVQKKANRIAEQLAFEYAQKYRLFTDYLLWEQFDLTWFCLEEIDVYKKCSLDRLALSKSEDKACKTAQMVKTWIRVYEQIRLEEETETAYRFFFTDEITADIAAKKMLQSVIRKEGLKRLHLKQQNWFDLSWICYYKLEKKEFDAVGWAKRIESFEQSELLQPSQIPGLVEHSYLLKNKKLKRQFADAVIEAVEQKTWRKRQHTSQAAKRGLQQYYRYLKRGSTISNKELEIQKNFLFSLHKIAVGYLPLLSLLFFFICLYQYSEIPKEVIFGMGIGFLVIFTIVEGAKIVKSGGIGEYLNQMGITMLSSFLIYFLFGILFLVPTGVVGFFWCQFPAFQQEPFYRKTMLGLITLGIYILIAVISTIWESFGEDNRE